MSNATVPDIIRIVGNKIILEKDGKQYAITDDYAIDADIHIEQLTSDGFSRVQLSFYTDNVHVGNVPEHATVTKLTTYGSVEDEACGVHECNHCGSDDD